jgi:CubicO group peptidase (beta-lactamase class C family)
MLHEKDLEVVLREIMTGWDVPGLAVGIVEGGEIIYAKGFGVLSLQTQAPVTLESVFCVQSVSKCFVATAVMQLAELGKLDLEAPIVQYLPYFQMSDEESRQISLRQALSHTSGMPDMDEFEYVELVTHPAYDDGAAERFVRSLHDRKLIAQPGERYRYSNIAYNVLGDLIARVSARSFESAMQEQILIRSGMPDSTFLPAELPAGLLAWPHLRCPEMRVNPIYPYHRADAPASFLHTTVVDMCHWCMTCLERGYAPGRSLLSSAGYEKMWKPAAQCGNRPGLYEQVGLGWFLGNFKGVKTICHGGAGFGGSSFLLILPEKNSAAVILCNEESYAHMRAVHAIADCLIGQKPQADTVSWMVPISRALAEGGMQAAYACLPGIKARPAEFYSGEGELLDLSLQIFTAGKVDLAIEVLGLNINIYPEHVESYLQRARLYQQKGETRQAREDLLKALSIEPENATAARLLGLVQ